MVYPSELGLEGSLGDFLHLMITWENSWGHFESTLKNGTSSQRTGGFLTPNISLEVSFYWDVGPAREGRVTEAYPTNYWDYVPYSDRLAQQGLSDRSSFFFRIHAFGLKGMEDRERGWIVATAHFWTGPFFMHMEMDVPITGAAVTPRRHRLHMRLERTDSYGRAVL